MCYQLVPDPFPVGEDWPTHPKRQGSEDSSPERPPSGFLSASLPLPFDSFASAFTCFWNAFARLRTSPSCVSSCFFWAVEVARDWACLTSLSPPVKSKAKYLNSARVLTEPRLGWASATICWAWAAAFRLASASGPVVEVWARLKRAPAISWAPEGLGLSRRPASGSALQASLAFSSWSRAAGVTVRLSGRRVDFGLRVAGADPGTGEREQKARVFGALPQLPFDSNRLFLEQAARRCWSSCWRRTGLPMLGPTTRKRLAPISRARSA